MLLIWHLVQKNSIPLFVMENANSKYSLEMVIPQPNRSRCAQVKEKASRQLRMLDLLTPRRSPDSTVFPFPAPTASSALRSLHALPLVSCGLRFDQAASPPAQL